MTKTENKWYGSGHAARIEKFPKTSCPYGVADKPIARAWWLAGYDDADMELVGALHRLIEGGEFADCIN